MATPTEWLNAFQVNTGAAATGGQGQPKIIGLSNGNILVAWVEGNDGAVAPPDGSTAAGVDIIGKIYDAEGNLVRDAYRLNEDRNFDDESDFDVAATNDGGFILVYLDDDIDSVNQTDIYWERFNANGDVLSGGAGGGQDRGGNLSPWVLGFVAIACAVALGAYFEAQ